MVRKQGDYYVVEVKCNKENGVELIEWLKQQNQKLDRMESTLTRDEMDLDGLLEKIRQHDGNNGLLFEVNFTNEEVALLAQMKFSN